MRAGTCAKIKDQRAKEKTGAPAYNFEFEIS
jgi:hypothetical protein